MLHETQTYTNVSICRVGTPHHFSERVPQ